MAKNIVLKDADNTNIYPTPAHMYKYMSEAGTATIQFEKGIWLVVTGRYSASASSTMGLYLLTTRNDLASKGQMREVIAPTGVTLSYDNTTAVLTITTTVNNIYVCALACHTW